MKKRVFAALLAALMMMSAFSASAADVTYTYNGNSTHTSSTDVTEACVFTPTVVPPTCLYGGYTVHTCEKCGHNYKDSYVDAPGAHQFSIWMIHDDATFTQDATETRRCVVCGFEETRAAEGTSFLKWFTQFDTAILGNAAKTIFGGVVEWVKLIVTIVKVLK